MGCRPLNVRKLGNPINKSNKKNLEKTCVDSVKQGKPLGLQKKKKEENKNPGAVVRHEKLGNLKLG